MPATSWAAACARARRRAAHLVAHATAPMRPLRVNPRAALAGLTPGPAGAAWRTLPYPNPMTAARGRGAGAGGAVRAQGRDVGAARGAAALPPLPGREGGGRRGRVRGRQAHRVAGRLPRRGAGSGPRGLGLGRRTACMGARRRTLQGPRVVLAVCGAAQHWPRRGAARRPPSRPRRARRMRARARRCRTARWTARRTRRRWRRSPRSARPRPPCACAAASARPAWTRPGCVRTRRRPCPRAPCANVGAMPGA